MKKEKSKREYYLKYSFPLYFVVTKKKMFGLIPYWSTIYNSGISKNAEEKIKELRENE